MNAISTFGVVLHILLVEYLGDDGQSLVVVMHDSIKNDFGKLTPLSFVILLIGQPQVLCCRP